MEHKSMNSKWVSNICTWVSSVPNDMWGLHAVPKDMWGLHYTRVHNARSSCTPVIEFSWLCVRGWASKGQAWTRSCASAVLQGFIAGSRLLRC